MVCACSWRTRDRLARASIVSVALMLRASCAVLAWLTLASASAAQSDVKDFLKAVRLNDLTSVTAHISAGGDAQLTDRDGRSALHVAVRYGHNKLVVLLLDSTRNVDQRDADGWTALHHAASMGDLVLTRQLLEYGAHPNATDEYHYGPLHLAAREGHYEVCEALVRAGANPKATIDVGFTPADLAEQHPELQDYLRALLLPQ